MGIRRRFQIPNGIAIESYIKDNIIQASNMIQVSHRNKNFEKNNKR